MLESMIKKLEELKGEEFTLSEMDNTIQGILYDVNATDKSSILDGDTEEALEREEYSYSVWEDERKIETVDINVLFSVIGANEEKFELVVEVTDIELL